MTSQDYYEIPGRLRPASPDIIGGASSRRVWLLWLVALASVWFLSVQCWMSWAIWQREGNVPPEPDDSYAYLIGAELVARYGSPLAAPPGIPRGQTLDWGMTHVTYNLTLGLLSRLTGLPVESLYHGSFFAGKVVLLAALLYLFSSCRMPLLDQAFALFGMAGYAGESATHGFYWVVPSFWALTIFLVTAGLVAGKPFKPKLALPLAALVGVLSFGIHKLTLWGTAVVGGFALLAALQSGNWRAYLRGRWVFLAGLMVGVAVAVGTSLLFAVVLEVPLPRLYPSTQSSTSLLGGASPGTSAWFRTWISTFQPPAGMMWRTYFQFLFQPQPYIIVLGLTLGLNWRRNRRPFPMLWLAALLGVIAVSIHPSGVRTVLFLWPLTYTLYGVAVGSVVRWLWGRFPTARFMTAALAAAIVVEGSLSVLKPSLPFIQSFRDANDYTWDKSCAPALLDASPPESIIEYSDKHGLTAFQMHGLLGRPRGSVRDYLARRAADPTYRGRYFYVHSPLAVIKMEEVEDALGRPLTLMRRCDYFTIYSG